MGRWFEEKDPWWLHCENDPGVVVSDERSLEDGIRTKILRWRWKSWEEILGTELCGAERTVNDKSHHLRIA